jgi:ATP-dependent helicase/nuclease subunit A
LKDEQARQLIVQQLDSCFLVEAGAGSGKTSSLVARMVALIKEGKCRAETMAAITFTRKAAQELRGRFQVALEKDYTKEADDLKRERLACGLEELDRCFLGTVHSFCASILRERPIEANLDPDFEELEDTEDTMLLEQAWSEYLADVQSNTPELLEDFRKLDVDVQDIKDCYQALSTYPDVEAAKSDVPMPDLEAARQELFSMLYWVEAMMPDKPPERGWDALQELLRTAIRRRRVFNLYDDIVFLKLLSDIDRSGGITQNRWNNPEDAKRAKERFEAFRTDYLEPAIRQWREYRHAPIMEFVLPAIAHYEDLKREKSKLNYQDLLMHTASMLRQNPEVRAYFQGRYTHLLVDEFQDTDPIQAEIMFYLTGQDINEQDWRVLKPLPGSLFVVGDPKQSIYRFRRADIDIYNDVKQMIKASGGAVLSLTTNFRSLDTLGDWANPVFRTLLAENENRFQAAFTGLETVRPVEGEHCSGLRKITISKIPYHKPEEIAKIDAVRIADWISMALSGGITLSRSEDERLVGLTEKPRPSDFLILMHYKANMDLYASALESRGIPYQIAGSGGFMQSSELRDILKLLQSLLDPKDPVRLVAVMRSCLFGISDSQLFRFKRAGGSFDFFSDIPEGLDAEDREAFACVFDYLRRFYDWMQNLPASAAIEAIITSLGSVPDALTGELGRSRSGRLMQCLELLANAERKGKTSLGGLVEHMTHLIDVGIEEEINIAPWESNYVRIMNLHKAKGLEAPVVFLANPAKNVTHTPALHICRSGGKPSGYFVIEKARGYSREVLGQPADWDTYCETEKQYLSSEENRLLYVAATRARNLLVISTYEGKPEINPWSPFDCHLSDIPELDACEAREREDVASNWIGLNIEDFLRAKTDMRSAWDTANTASYSRVSVTALVEGEQSAPSRKMTRRGQSWGNVIHKLLDACAKGSDGLEQLTAMVLSEEGRNPQEASRALQEIHSVLDSPLWKRVIASSQRYSEVPFFTKMELVEPETAGNDSIVSGTIDLVFKEDDGWAIVDFKTDTVSDEQQMALLAAYYAPQLELYRKAWESMTGEPVHEVVLFFTAINTLLSAKKRGW